MKKRTHKRQTNARHPERNRKRFGILLIGVTALIGLAFVCRFAYITLGGQVDNNNLQAYRNTNYNKRTVLKAKRGAIYDSTGNVIAEDANTYTLYAVLDKTQVVGKHKLYVTNKDKTATVLAKYLPLAKDKILAYLTPANKKTLQVEFGLAGRGLSLTIKKQIEAEKLPGIGFSDSPSRLYPNGAFASYTVGLARAASEQTDSALTGVMGLEKQFNTLLKGTDGWTKRQTDSSGAYTLPNTKATTKKAVDGGAVYTTLNTNLQAYLETLMTTVETEYAPKVLNAVLMDAKTGAILAASSRPTFDPSTGEGLGTVWRNALVEDAFEPGSVMKIFTLASAIDTGTYHPNETFQSGTMKVAGGTVADWDPEGWGSIPISQAFARSANTGMVKVEQAVGVKNQSKYLKAFGFGQKTGVALPSENAGAYNLTNELQRLNIAFGQGISVNVMQLLRGVTAITNQGAMIEPRIVSKTVSATGKVTNYGRQVVGHPIKASTASAVLDEMKQVVSASYGTGVPYRIDGVDLAMKTGTAQVPRADGKGYIQGAEASLHSVLAVAPASDPQYVVYVNMREPQKQTASAAQIINEVFQPLLKRALALDEGQAAGTGAAVRVTVPAVTNATPAKATATLTAAKLTVSTVGTGNRIVQQLPTAGAAALDGARVVLLTNGAMTMPDVTGWSKSDVLKLAQLTGKKFTLKGSGYVTHQSLAAGSLLTDQPVTLTFKQTAQ
ncbi:penicillin-binding transpeptidase domain-containing protein [Lacticaseibacillus daqingensis]|uniref:penicillin-binding transpeptidase domain-containing protein n=1 Tax=Lacticaseibacillus daqingensis TaxID=2486014 RepID=UPI000F784A3A|nr:penicillin-binding transpeptidase domain-containing protein [Lacticaseibacillus daqingensis]